MFKIKNCLFALTFLVSAQICATNDVFYAALNNNGFKALIVDQADLAVNSLNYVTKFLQEFMNAYKTLTFEEKENVVQSVIDFLTEAGKLNSKYSDLALIEPKVATILQEFKSKQQELLKKNVKMDLDTKLSEVMLQRFNIALNFNEIYFTAVNDLVKTVNGLNDATKLQIVEAWMELSDLFKSEIMDSTEVRKITKHMTSIKFEINK